MSVPWIHCNICLRLPSANCRFYISNCSHISCDRCVQKKLIAPTCSLCNRETKVEPINKDLKPELRKYFVNLNDYAVKAFREIKDVIEFQGKNCRRLLKHKMEKIQELQNTTIKHSEDAATIAKLQKQIDELQATNLQLQTENKNLNSSFLDQQNLFNQLFAGNPAAASMNITPTFFQQPSLNGANVTQQDLFNLVNASYLNGSSAAPIRHDGINLQESIESPQVLALDQSSLNFGQLSFNGAPPRQSGQQAVNPNSRPSNQQPFNLGFRPSSGQPASNGALPRVSSGQQSASSTMRPVPQQIPEGFKTPTRPRVSEPRHFSSAGPPHRLHSIAPNRNIGHSASKLNQTSRSFRSRSDGTIMSTRTTQSAPSRSLYKAPVVTALTGLQTPQPQPSIDPRSQRSRTVCPHWPRSRCRCNK